MKKRLYFLFIIVSLFIVLSCHTGKKPENDKLNNTDTSVSLTKPYVLWWWFAGEIQKSDVASQLDWLREQNIGGVLIFFMYPPNRMKNDTINYFPRYEFAGKDFQELCTYTKQYADSIHLGCNFLMGTGWPYGGTFIPLKFAQQIWTKDSITHMRSFTRVSWEYPKKGYVMDHLSKEALDFYFEKVGKAFEMPINAGKSPTYLECDSWEIAEFEPIWTPGFRDLFQKTYGYDIQPYLEKLYENSSELYDVRYDYYNLVSKLALSNFYKHLTSKMHEIGGRSVVECCGTPADLMSAYAEVDLPMTEAMLYEPNYSKIPASVCAITGKNILTSESFTCAYGWKDDYGFQEQTADLKLVADALFANGVNHHHWHGFPFNPKGSDSLKYYATIYLSPKSPLMKDFKQFNQYMEKVSAYMQKGKTYTDIAVYLPVEDRWAEGVYSKEFLNSLRKEELNWHFSKYQLRYEYFPKELEGYPMLWINSDFLKNAVYENNRLVIGNASFSALYLDATNMNIETLRKLFQLAKQGLPVCLKKQLREPGKVKHKEYTDLLKELTSLQNVSSDASKIIRHKPFIEGKDLPDYWCREVDDSFIIFFANPKCKNLKYPLTYGQSYQEKSISQWVTINYKDKSIPIDLLFKPYQSVLLKVTKDWKYEIIDIGFTPEVPLTKPKNQEIPK